MSAAPPVIPNVRAGSGARNRDLFRAMFEEFSQFDWSTYRSEFLFELPKHLLSAAGKSDPALQQSSRFQLLCQKVSSVSREQWNNPELYPHLFALLRRSSDSSDKTADRCIRNIEFQLGEVELDVEQFSSGFYRRRVPRANVFHICDGCVYDLAELVIPNPAVNSFPLFYMPFPELFTDVVGPDVYDGSRGKFTVEYAQSMIAAGASSLLRYSPELYAGFCEAIGVVALTSGPDVADRSSFSSRMYYAGGVFSSLLTDNVPALLENLIHEYYHQRLWVWWSIEGPHDLPPETLMIESPVTRAQKSVSVMLHAFLIYIGVCAYYQFALEHEAISESTAHWVERRLARLSVGTIELRDLLLKSLSGYPESLRLAQFLADMIPARTH